MKKLPHIKASTGTLPQKTDPFDTRQPVQDEHEAKEGFIELEGYFWAVSDGSMIIVYVDEFGFKMIGEESPINIEKLGPKIIEPTMPS